MDEVLEILRDDRVKELIEKTARYYYTSTAVNVDLTIPGIVVGLFLFGENVENILGCFLIVFHFSVLAITGGWYAETFGSVLKNLLTFLPRLLLAPIKKVVGPVKGLAASLKHSDALKGLAATLKQSVSSLETTWDNAAYGSPSPSYGAPESSYGAPVPSYTGYARSVRRNYNSDLRACFNRIFQFQEEGENLSKLVSSNMEAGEGAVVEPQISLDTLTGPLEQAQKLIQ